MVKTTHLGGTASNIVTPVIGHGLMLMTARASAHPDEQCFESIKATINALPPGAKAFLNSGDFYGFPPNLNGNLDLVKRYFDKYPEDKENVFISVKGGLDFPGHVPNSSPEALRTGVDNIIAKLGGKKLDLFQPARVDKKYPIEDTMKFLAQLVKEGKFDHIGLSEISADTLRRAHAVHPVSVVEIEVSPWSYDDHCIAVIALAKELGVAIAAYSPLGHGVLTGAIKKNSDIPEGDFRRHLQRFQDENLAHNIGIVDKITAVAEKKKVTPGQLSLAWVCSRGEHVIPIPGSSHPKRTLENVAACDITLTPEEIKEIDEIIASHTMIGGRYFGNPEAENLSI